MDNYPNPLLRRFDLPEIVNLTIYNMLGQRLKPIQCKPHQQVIIVTWNATNDLGVPVSAGGVSVSIAEGFIKTKKMVLLK